jgi:hypothetical protein
LGPGNIRWINDIIIKEPSDQKQHERCCNLKDPELPFFTFVIIIFNKNMNREIRYYKRRRQSNTGVYKIDAKIP